MVKTEIMDLVNLERAMRSLKEIEREEHNEEMARRDAKAKAYSDSCRNKFKNLLAFLVLVLLCVSLYIEGYIYADACEVGEGTLVLEDFNQNIWECSPTISDSTVHITEHYYPLMLVITDTEGDCIDWFIGDIVVAIMYDNGTDTIYDDEIICIRYNGWLTGWINQLTNL